MSHSMIRPTIKAHISASNLQHYYLVEQRSHFNQAWYMKDGQKKFNWIGLKIYGLYNALLLLIYKLHLRPDTMRFKIRFVLFTMMRVPHCYRWTHTYYHSLYTTQMRNLTMPISIHSYQKKWILLEFLNVTSKGLKDWQEHIIKCETSQWISSSAF